jgi:tetratricopeptide (TPR) repeat protein
LDQSEPLLRQTYEKRKATNGPNDRETLISQTNLGSLLYNRRRYSEAVDVLKSAVDGWLQLTDGESDRYAIMTIGELGVSYLSQGDLTQARIHLDRAVKLGRTYLKPQDPEFIKFRGNLAVLASEMGDLATALTLNKEILDEAISILGPKHSISLNAMHDRAALYGRLREAAKERKLLETIRQICWNS